MTDSRSIDWHAQPGAVLAARYLHAHAVPVVTTPLRDLPQLSRRMIGFALRLYPSFLDRVDFTFPIVVAGKRWYQIALDGRHRISKATWTGRPDLPACRVPLWYALELLVPGVYEAEWLGLNLGRGLRRIAARRPASAT